MTLEQAGRLGNPSIRRTGVGAGRGRRLAIALLALAAIGGPAPRASAGDVVLDEPADGAFLAKREIPVRGSVADASITSVVVNGKDVPVRDGRFETQVVAPDDGPFEIRVVSGVVGKPAIILKRVVEIDRTEPRLTIDDPRTREAEFPGAEGSIRGRADDDHLARVEMNGVGVAFAADGSFLVPFVLPAAGDLVVEVVAVDRAGNRATASRVLRRRSGAAAPVPAPDAGLPRGVERRGVVPGTPELRRATVPPLTRAKSEGDASAKAVDDALGWLAAHQSADGGFEAEGFRLWCERTQFETYGVDGRGKANYDVGVTGLAVLAFLGAGYTGRSEGPYGRVVGDGLRYLRNAQDAEGCIGPRSTGHYVYNHAIASLAILEAYEKTESAGLKASSQKALDFIAIARNPYFAWRYGIKPGDNDTSTTGWMLHALLAARRINRAAAAAGRPVPLEVEVEAFEGALAWIDKMTDPETGRLGYQVRGSGGARTVELQDRFPTERSESMTGVGLYARLRIAEPAAAVTVLESPAVRAGFRLLETLPPVWNPNDGSIDVYYWYYGSLACHAAGGAIWGNWRKALEAALLPAQRTDGDPCSTKGSFDPIDPWGGDGGRVYMTALAALCLETADRDEPSLSK